MSVAGNVNAEPLPSLAFITSAIVSLRKQHRRETQALIPRMQRGDEAARERAQIIVRQVEELAEWCAAFGFRVDPMDGTFDDLLCVGELACAVFDDEYLRECGTEAYVGPLDASTAAA